MGGAGLSPYPTSPCCSAELWPKLVARYPHLQKIKVRPTRVLICWPHRAVFSTGRLIPSTSYGRLKLEWLLAENSTVVTVCRSAAAWIGMALSIVRWFCGMSVSSALRRFLSWLQRGVQESLIC